MRTPVIHRSTGRTAVTWLAAPFLIIMLAACGDPGTGPGVASANGGATPTASASNASQEGDPVKFAECMRKHGIDVQLEDGGKGMAIRGKEGQQGQMEEAQRDCKQYAPQGGPGDGKPMSKEDQEKFLKFAQCMRDHGIPMADPEFEGGGVKMKIGDGRSGPKIDDSKVEAAQKECQKILPEPPGGAGSGPQKAGPGSAVGGGA